MKAVAGEDESAAGGVVVVEEGVVVVIAPSPPPPPPRPPRPGPSSRSRVVLSVEGAWNFVVDVWEWLVRVGDFLNF